MSPILGTAICPSVFRSLEDPRDIDFSMCSALCLLGQSGDFQAPHMWNWEPWF